MSARTAGRRWFPKTVDVRSVVGVALVIGSIAGVWAVVTAADRSVPVYAAGSTIVAGSTVTPDDLVVRQVSLGGAHELYVAPGGIERGTIATRTIYAGEFVPGAALGSSGDLARAPVMVTVAGELPEGVAEGREVDVWAVGSAEADESAPPSVLVPEATVVRIAEEDGIVTGAADVSVELSVPDGSVAVLLAATAAEDALTLVPVDGGAR